jgi:hypothetical protein
MFVQECAELFGAPICEFKSLKRREAAVQDFLKCQLWHVDGDENLL